MSGGVASREALAEVVQHTVHGSGGRAAFWMPITVVSHTSVMRNSHPHLGRSTDLLQCASACLADFMSSLAGGDINGWKRGE